MNDFVRVNDGGFVYYKSKIIEDTGFVKHMFTTRMGGVSENETASLNLGINKNDKKENVIENFKRVCKRIGTDIEKVCVLKQIHTDNVHIIDGSEKSLIYNTEERIRADALVSGVSQSAFGVFCADCVPVILADKKTKTAAAVHSGWRSTAMHICRKAVKIMREEFGAENICAAIGPSIRQCCFETDIDCANEFDKRYIIKKGEKYHIDLQRAVIDDLIGEGVLKENISDSGICTCCRSSEFFSNRAAKGKMGLMGGFVKID